MRKIENSVSSSNEVSLWKKGVAAVVATAALSACGGNGGGEANATPDRPAASQSASETVQPIVEEVPSETPSETPTTSTPEVIDTAVTPTELTVDRYSDGESLVNAFMAQKSAWINAGGSPETKANEPLTANHNDYLAEVAAEYDTAYVDALYVSDWASRPELAVEVEEKIRMHFGTLSANIGTTDSTEPADVEPYVATWTVTSVTEVSNTGDEIVVEYDTLREDNSDMNRAAEFVSPTYADPTPGTNRLTWVQEDGVWKIAGDTAVN